MTSPADEMRQAAKALRCKHTFRRVETRPGVLTRQDRCALCGIYWHRRDAVAKEVAETLAAWLEGTADDFEAEQRTEPIDSSDEHALAFARLINGGAS